MYTSFFGLQEKPFAITPDPRYLYLSERHAEALAHLLYGINEAGGFIQLTGEVGTGKTTIIRSLLEQLPANADVALILNPRVTPAEFLLTICEELRIPVPEPGRGSVKLLMDLIGRRLLDTHARGRRVVLIVDEAQNLSAHTLEQVRLLTNLETATTKLLQIILIGQPELRDLLARPELRQLAQRITARYHLNPLSSEETAGYIKHRMRVAGATAEAFTPASLAEVHRLSGGVPRIINVICDRALLGAFTHEDHRVSGKLVRDAATQVYGRPMPAPWLRWAIIGSIAAALALVAAGLWSLLASRPPASADATAAEAAPVASNQIARAETTEAPPPAPPSFDEVLARHGNDTTTEAALGKLFASWGATYDPSGGRGCDQAAHQGLECLFQKGSWAQLRTLNRPAILTLTDDIGRTHQVLLTSLGEETATIDLGGESRPVSIAGMSRYWFGDFLLLWRPPLAVAKALAPGMRGADVRWLRENLRVAQGLPAAPAGSDFYDEDLARLVQDFQRQHRLNIDGVAGVQTQIVLDTVVNATGSPTIVAQISGG
ncbi:MAG TPA: AAA family ATPase [Steroidobacteraceae bacterium]|jgi:general secretion pathway protein A|nr:AAA family ATPase [Steroidobacteraceae bacterium]